MSERRKLTLEELALDSAAALELVEGWIAEGRNQVEVLPCTREVGAETLLALQVTTHSPLGAIAYETGGLLVDHGWVRILGAGCPRLPRSVAAWNGWLPGQTHRIPGALLVGDDVVGGFFAWNGDALPGGQTVHYLAPDTLEWEDTELGYSDWLVSIFQGDLEEYYANARWPGWEEEVRDLPGDRGISIVPFLCAEGPPVAERSRRPVPLEELWGLHAGNGTGNRNSNTNGE